jgi:hypothetical protein
VCEGGEGAGDLEEGGGGEQKSHVFESSIEFGSFVGVYEWFQKWEGRLLMGRARSRQRCG